MIPTEPDTTPTYLFNPSKDDFIYPWDKIDHVLPSRKLVTFPKWLADHLAKHLAAKLAQEDSERMSNEDKLNKWKSKILININE